MKNIRKNTPLTRLVAGSLVAASCFAMISAVPACADDKVFTVNGGRCARYAGGRVCFVGGLARPFYRHCGGFCVQLRRL